MFHDSYTPWSTRNVKIRVSAEHTREYNGFIALLIRILELRRRKRMCRDLHHARPTIQPILSIRVFYDGTELADYDFRTGLLVKYPYSDISYVSFSWREVCCTPHYSQDAGRSIKFSYGIPDVNLMVIEDCAHQCLSRINSEKARS